MSQNENVLEKTYLTKMNKFSFAVSGFGQNLIIGFVSSYILFFYTDVFLLGAAPAGILVMTARIWDAMMDPIMGTVVDKTRSKWGKMRPYILFISVPLAVSTATLFIIPSGLGVTGKIVYAYITYILWGMIYTVCDVPFWGLASAMTPNPKERISFISTSRLVHSIGGALPMVIAPLFISALGNKNGYTAAGVTIGIVGGALFLLAFFGTEERSKTKDKAPTLRECFGLLKINQPLRCVVGTSLLGFMRAVPIVAGMYIATYVLGPQALSFFGKSFTLGGATLNTVLIAGWGVSGYLGMILTPKICARYNFRQIYYISSVVGVVACVGLFFVPKTLLTIFLCMLIVGLPYGVISNINYSMFADSVDYVEWKTGKRAEGVTISFQTLMNKTMTAFQSGAVSAVLIFAKFVPPQKIAGVLVVQHQNPHTITGMILLITLLPAIGWAIGIIPMKYYTFIGDERVKAHKEIVRHRQEVQDAEVLDAEV
jgi:sugar (glycoside-pentoside-hexuronide) transporter